MLPEGSTMASTTASAKDEAIFEQRPPLRALAPDERLAHLAASNHGVLGTLTRSGFPHLTTVVYRWDPAAGLVRISTTTGRARALNVRRDGRAALFVQGPDMWSF